MDIPQAIQILLEALGVPLALFVTALGSVMATIEFAKKVWEFIKIPAEFTILGFTFNRDTIASLLISLGVTYSVSLGESLTILQTAGTGVLLFVLSSGLYDLIIKPYKARSA